MTKKLQGKLALITGASRGIGAEIARKFAREGADLILLATNVRKMEALDDELAEFGGNVTLVPLDLEDFTKIEMLGHSIASRFGKLDILIGNAGKLGVLSPVNHQDIATWQSVFNVNVHANWALIKALDPLLRAAPNGRAIFMTANQASQIDPYWSAYGASKAALENLVRTYEQEIVNICPNYRVHTINPGAVKTDLYSTAFPGNPEARSPSEVAELCVEMCDSSRCDFPVMMDATSVAA